MRSSTARFEARRDSLSAALTNSRMERLWQRSLRRELRSQAVGDLHDYYDFQVHRRTRIEALRDRVLAGDYRPGLPVRLRSEKRDGISRQIVVLRAEDALLMDALADYLLDLIAPKQPTSRAYFSRKGPIPKSVKDFDANLGYPWWFLWPKFQREIMEFSARHPIVVVTDVANYFDSVEFGQLRNFLSHYLSDSEPFLDLLFFLLERFVWRPDYLPHPGRGLPQADLDCPRLLAHTFLFELDEFLNRAVDGEFVRWMDDIDFGCRDRKQAATLLQQLDDLLLSRGLRLNAGKTKVLDRSEATLYFQLDENRYLNVYKNRIKRLLESGANVGREDRARLRRRYSGFQEGWRHGQGSKVMKRFFNLAGQLEDSHYSDDALRLLFTHPNLRETVLRYLQRIGWSLRRERLVVRFVDTTLDDVSMHRATRLLIGWRPVGLVKYVARMRALAFRLAARDRVGFLCALWLAGKFCSAKQLATLLRRSERLWSRHDWLARQVAALLPRCDQETREWFYRTIARFGLVEAKNVVDNFSYISKDEETYKTVVEPFIKATSGDGSYPLPKQLISLSLVSSALPRDVRCEIGSLLAGVVQDPVYRSQLKRLAPSCPKP